MEVFVETQSGSTFSIEVNSWDTLLDIKEKIEKSQGIPVSIQTLFFQGKHLPRDELLAEQYDIVDKSRLYIFFPNQENYQVVQQTEQSPVPSKPIEDWSEKNQDSSLMATSENDQVHHRTEQSTVPSDEFSELLNYDWSSMAMSNDEHVVDQTDKSLESSYSVEEFLCGDEWPATTEGNFNNNQDSSMGNNEYQDWLQEEPSPPSNLLGDFMFDEDKPLSTGHFTNIQTFWPGTGYENQVFQTEQWPVPSSSSQQRINAQDFPGSSNQVLQTEHWPVPLTSTEQSINTQDFPGSSSQLLQTNESPVIKEVINVPDSPVKARVARKPPQKLRVMMLPYSREDKPVRKFPMEVNASENVEELKKKLEKVQQRYQFKLPEKGYIFIHEQRVLDFDQSFRWNCVAHGDTIEFFPGTYTKK
ncbi:unnamed protein product [Thlaspi arvense]|uniref:Ubiquitin-like domain-containing protein n=1 Tax=Thlaspi arvense TaxID=13288 RepID=A0AAU9SVE9_THLAR|nr:unnamed protein product [Thlaspi arvense]